VYADLAVAAPLFVAAIVASAYAGKAALDEDPHGERIGAIAASAWFATLGFASSALYGGVMTKRCRDRDALPAPFPPS